MHLIKEREQLGECQGSPRSSCSATGGVTARPAREDKSSSLGTLELWICRAGGCPGSGEQPGQGDGLCFISERAGHGQPRPEFCGGPTSPCPHVCPHGCPLMCSHSSVLNNPDNPSSNPLPNPHVGSGWGWERLRESKNSARTQQKLLPARRAWGETPQGQAGVPSWFWETQTE